MSDAHLITAKFATVNRLKEICRFEKISFTSSESLEMDSSMSPQQCETLITSGQYLNKVGKEAMVSFAKAIKANQVCIINDEHPEFRIKTELGGRMLIFSVQLQVVKQFPKTLVCK